MSITSTPTQHRVHVETWGDGAPVVLVHGSLATGAEEWDAQRPLGDQGFRLVVFDRRGYGGSEIAEGEDYLVDAEDIAELMGDGAHLVGHSYGGLGVLYAAARRPEATRSLTVLEPAVAAAGRSEKAWRDFVDEVQLLWTAELPDADWVVRFLCAAGSDPSQFPPDFLSAALPTVPTFRRGRPFFQAVVPFTTVAAATFPKLVVSGGHHAGFEAMCADLAQRIGGAHIVVEGAGHEIQFTGQPINDRLLELWRS